MKHKRLIMNKAEATERLAELRKELNRLDVLMVDCDSKNQWRAGDRVAQRIDKLEKEARKIKSNYDYELV